MTRTMVGSNSTPLNLSGEGGKDIVLLEVVGLRNIKDVLNSFSRTTRFTLHIFSEKGDHLFSTGENPYCKLIKSILQTEIDCPGSCSKSMNEMLMKEGPVVYKCNAMVVNFSFLLQRFGQRVMVTGRGGFAEYGDLVEFLRMCKDKDISDIPVSGPLDFHHDEAYALEVARSLSHSLNSIIDGLVEKNEMEVKLRRLTSLLDHGTIETLSKNKELMYMYILDTIEFILGRTSTSMMVLEKLTSTYKTLYSTGIHKDLLKGFTLSIHHPVIKEILKSRSSVYPVDSSELSPNGGLKGIESVYLFPIFISDEIEGLVCIFDRVLTTEEIRIIKAFRDYIQVTLENQGLRLSINRKLEEILSSLLDISRSIAPLLDPEHLFQTILDKSLQLLNAEQGSLMILDHNTSELLVEARKGYAEVVSTGMRLKTEECIAGKVVESGRPLLVKDIERDPVIKQPNRPHYKTRSFISMPIKIEDRVEGVINVSDKMDGHTFDEYDLKLLESFTANAAIAIQRSLFYKQTESLKELSITDPLTGLYNRRHINDRLKEEVTRFKRYYHPFSFLMMDIDNFKAYNDTFGHIKGDQVLKVLADTVAGSLRTIDIAGRFGGDEFVVILSQTPKVDAISIANRLKEKINAVLSKFNVEESSEKMTISMGLTTFPDDTSFLEEILEKTDEMLYLAKKGGGNRISHL